MQDPKIINIAMDTTKYTFLALGDSYTYGQNVDSNMRFYVQLIDSLRRLDYKIADPKMIAVTGWTTGDLLQAIVSDGDTGKYDFVFLLIGVNNQFQGLSQDDYRNQFITLLQQSIHFAGNKADHVYVLSIPDYGYTPSFKKKQVTISKEIEVFNNINKEESLKLAVQYIYITDLTQQGLNDPTLIASDGLHPSGKMYGLWANRILPVITSDLKK